MNRFRNIKSRKKKISFFTTIIILSSIIFFSSNSSIMNIGENAIGTVTSSITRIVYSSIASSKEVFTKIFGSKSIREENEKLKIAKTMIEEGLETKLIMKYTGLSEEAIVALQG